MTTKDMVTNWMAVLAIVVGVGQVILQAVQGYLHSVTDVNWVSLGFAVAVAVIGYFTGKPNE